MDYQLLSVFREVANQQHFGHAAETLNMTQPAVSRAIRRLEKDLGTDLFSRSSQGVSLTLAGEALEKRAPEILKLMDSAINEVQDVSRGVTGSIRIASSGATTNMIVSAVTRHLASTFPGVKVRFSTGNFANQALAKLEKDEADLVLGRWPELPDTFCERVIEHDRVAVAVPANSELASYKELEIGDVSDVPCITLPAEAESHVFARFVEALNEKGLSINVNQTAPDTFSALSLVSAGMGMHITPLSSSRVVASSGFCIIPFTDISGEIDLKAAWRKDDSNPILQYALTEIEKQVRPNFEDVPAFELLSTDDADI